MLQKIHLYPPAHYVRVLGKMGEFTGTPFPALLRKGRALFATGSDPPRRRPCPSGDSLTGIHSRAKGFLSLKKTVMNPMLKEAKHFKLKML